MQEIQERSFPQFHLLPKELRVKIWKYAIPRQQLIEIWWNSEFLPEPGNEIRITGQPPPPPRRRPPRYPRVPKRPAPAILHVCHEAREVGLQRYQLTLDSKQDDCRQDTEKRNGKYSKGVVLRDITWPTRPGEHKMACIDFHSVTTMYCNIEQDAIFLNNGIWASAFLNLSITYLLPIIHEPVLGRLRYLVVVHQVRGENWAVSSQDCPNHIVRNTHMGRDLRALKGLPELRELVVIVPLERRWDLKRVREVFEEEIEWAFQYEPERRRPKVRVLEDERTARGMIEMGDILLGE